MIAYGLATWLGSVAVGVCAMGYGGFAAAGDGDPRVAERVVLPFSCAVDGADLHILPAAPRYYDIVGSRKTRTIEACAISKHGATSAADCRPMTVHAFDLACDGGQAPWYRVAAIATALLGGGVRLNGDTLRLQFRGRLRPWPQAPCLKGDWPHRGDPLTQPSLAFPDVGCEAVGSFEPHAAYYSLKDGLAPLEDLGARIVPVPKMFKPAAIGASVPLPDSNRGQGPRIAGLATPLPPGGSITVASDRKVSDRNKVEASRRVRTAAGPASQSNNTVTSQPWMTLVEVRRAAAGSDGMPPGRSQQQFERSIMIALLALALVASVASGLGWFMTARQHRPFRPADAYEVILRRDGVDLDLPEAQICGELCRSAQGLVEEVHRTIDTLQGVAPLRRTLLREIRDLEHYLSGLVASAPHEPHEWKRMRAKLQRVVNDILRLRDIVDSAHRSLSVARIERGLPRDKSEAFEALGANPTTSEKILKKLVDALRATWHPDLAVNDDDRRAREDRIKQINVAWDLICDHRAEA